MTVAIQQGKLNEIKHLIDAEIYPKMTKNEQGVMNECLGITEHIWYGTVSGDVACIWGLIPPSLLSNRVYLWLYVTEVVQDHQFVFVRYSQRAVEQILVDYDEIVGHCIVGEHRSIRWIKWLGGVFGDADGKKIPFKIVRKLNG